MEEIAAVYSRALFETAKEHGELDRIQKELAAFVDELARNRDLQIFFFSPYFSSEQKKDAIGKAISGADERFVRFLELVAERHRMPVLFRIRAAFDELWAHENRLLPVAVTSAVALDERTMARIGKRIEQETGRRVELTANVDADTLGGLVVRVGNTIFDASVRARLERLRREVTRAA